MSHETYLKFGDTVALYVEDHDGFFSAQGFVDSACKFAVTEDGNTLPPNFRDSLFIIHPVQQYASGEELAKYLNSPAGHRPLSDPEHKNLLEFLQDNARNEQALNRELITSVMGKHVTYGQTLQFLHVKSQTYVTLNTRVLSDLEKDNVKAQLAEGGLNSWFNILPRYKVRSEGEKVFIKDGVLFKNMKSELYLHVSQELLPEADHEQRMREVNCSLTASSWKFSLFSEFEPDAEDLVKFGDIVQIHHPEEESFLSFVSEGSAARSPQDQCKAGGVELVENKDGRANASSLWEVVNMERDTGGIAEFQNPMMLRHVVTGAYLSVLDKTSGGGDDEDEEIDITDLMGGRKGGSSTPAYRLGGTLSPTDKSRVFIHYTSLMDDSRIQADSSCHLEIQRARENLWIHTESVDARAGHVSRPISAKEGQMVGKLLIERPAERCVVVSAVKREEDAFRIQAATVEDTKDVYYIQSLLPNLRSLCDKLKVKRKEGLSSAEIMSLTTVLADLIFFTTGNVSKADPFNVNAPPVRRRQNFLREMLVDILFEIIELPFKQTQYGQPIMQLNTLEENNGLFFQAVQLTYKLIIHIFKGDTRNQLYVSHYISVIVGQLGYNVYAEDCLTELLMNNRQLLERVDDNTINIFVQLLWQKGKNAKYVHFLTALCSCLGEAIEDNQERMCDLLLKNDKNADQLLIHIRSRDKKVEVSWKERTGQWMDINAFANSNSPDTQRVLEYYEATLLLFSRMCLDRNYNVMTVLEKTYPKELVLKCMCMDGLPTSLRSAFITLMLRLHIDRDQSIDVVAPRYTRVWSQLREDLPSAADSEQFQIVEEYVRDCLTKTDTDNTLLLAVLQVLRYLLVIGSFSTVEEVHELVAAVLAALDRPPASVQEKQIDGVPPIPELLSRARDEPPPSSTTGPPPHDADTGKSIELVEVESTAPKPAGNTGAAPTPGPARPVLPHEAPRAPTGIKKNLAGIKKLKAVSERIMNVKRLAKRKFFSFAGSTGGETEKLDSEKGGLYPYSEQNIPIIDAKRQMCEILAHTSDLRVDFRLSKLLLTFKGTDSDVPIPELMTKKDEQHLVSRWDKVFTEKDWRVLNLETISPEVEVVDILLEMLLYDGDDLFVSALNALVKEHSQRSEFNRALRKIQLLEDSGAIQVWQEAQSALIALKTVAETEEIWKSNAGERTKKLAEMIQILKKFSSFAVIERDDETIPRTENQRILRNLSVHEHVISVLKLPFSNVYRPLFVECYSFLKKFCYKDEENQLLLYKHLEFFLGQMGANLGIPEMLTAMFDQNVELLDHVDVHLCRHFATLFIQSSNPRPEFLRLFSALIDANGIPVRRNQNLVLSVITDGAMKEKITHYLFASPQGRKARIELMKAREHNKPNSQLRCHIEILRLLGLCSGGQNYIAEALCQSLMALEDAIDTVLDPMTIPDVAGEALGFIRSVYFDVESQYRGLESNEKLVNLLSYCTQMIERAYLMKSEDVMRAFVIRHIVPTVSTFLKFVLPALEVQDVFGMSALSTAVKNLSRAKLTSEEEEIMTQCIDLCNANNEAEGTTGDSVAAAVLRGAKEAAAAEEKKRAEEARKAALVRQKSKKSGLTQATNAVDDFRTFASFITEQSESVDAACLEEFRALVRHIKGLNLRDRPEGRLTLSFRAIALRLISFCSANMMSEDIAVPILKILQEIIWTEEEDSPERKEMQQILDELGATKLMVKLVSHEGVDDDVVQEAYSLGTALLHGGNLSVQDSLYEHLTKTHEEAFFSLLRTRIRDIIANLREKSASVSTGGGRDDFGPLPEKADMKRETQMLMVTLRLLQLLCEGHHANLQNYVRVQEANSKSISVLNLVVDLWLSVEKAVDDRLMPIAIQLFNSLTEFIQGPCIENQTALVGTKILDSANRIMRSAFPGCDPDYVDDLKTGVIEMLLSLMEGRRDSLIHERLITTLDIKTLTQQLPKILHAHREFGEDTEAGFAIFILLKTLADYDNSLFDRFDPDRMVITAENETKVKEYSEAYEFFNKSTGALEVQKEGATFRVYFTIPNMCHHMTEASIEHLKWDVNRDTANDKVSDLMERSDDLIAEMQHQESLSKRPFIFKFSSHFSTLKNAASITSLLINTLLMVFFTVRATEDNDVSATLNTPFAEAPVDMIIIILGGLLSIIAFLLCIAYLIQYGKLRIRFRWKQERVAHQHDLRLPSDTSLKRLLVFGETEVYDDSKANPLVFLSYWWVSLYYIMTDLIFAFYFLYLIFAIIGMIWTPLFFGFHLLDIVVRSDTLKNVIRAVTDKGGQLLLTAALGLVLVYLFGAVAFAQFRHYYKEEGDGGVSYTCDSIAACFATTLIQGLGNDGGIGGYLERPPIASGAYVTRLFFDLAFFFIVPILIMNIVFGIIIDTFAALRGAKEAKGEDMLNKCFICHIDRDNFDRYARGFEHHIIHDHNMWVYLYYVAYLRFKDDSEYTGIESYVAKAINAKSIEWFPLHTAIVLEGQAEEQKESVEELQHEVSALSSQLASVQAQLVQVLNEVTSTSLTRAVSSPLPGRRAQTYDPKMSPLQRRSSKAVGLY